MSLDLDQDQPSLYGLAQVNGEWDPDAEYVFNQYRTPSTHMVTYNDGLYVLVATPDGTPPGEDSAWLLMADISGGGPGGGIASINGNQAAVQTIVGTGITTVTSSGGVTTVATPAPARITSINGNTTPAQTIVGTGTVTVTSSGGVTTINSPAGSNGITSINGSENAAQLVVGTGGTTVSTTGATTTITSPNALLSINGNSTQAQTIQGGGITSVISSNGITTVLTNAVTSINGNTTAAQTIVGAGSTTVTSNAGTTTITSAVGVTSVGTFGTGTQSANGASIDGGVIYLQAATALQPGLMTTSAQTISGAKTFSGGIIGALTGNASTATLATTATNVAAGGANRIVYQTGSGATSFLPAPSISNSFLTWDGTTFGWVLTPPDGLDSVGTIDSVTPSANGAAVSGSALVMQSASETMPGLVTTANQVWAGQKEFVEQIIGELQGNALTASGIKRATVSALIYQSAEDVSSGLPLPSTPDPVQYFVYYDGDTGEHAYTTSPELVDLNVSGTAAFNNVTAGLITAALNGMASDNTTYTPDDHGVVISGAGNAMRVITPAASGLVLTSTGTGTDPTWQAPASSGVTSLGTFSTSATAANGAAISGSVLTLQAASSLAPGLVSTGDQVWAGVKTLTSAPILSSLSASLPLQLDGSKNVISAAIDVSSQVTGVMSNSHTTSEVTNNPNTLVERDASGNFAAGTITADLVGNADTATSLAGAVTNANFPSDPTDGSGASLVFTGIVAKYSQLGNQVNASVLLTYPTTSNTNNAAVSGLPVTSTTNQVVPVFSTGFSGGLIGVIGAGTSIVFLYHISTGLAVTNVELTGVQIMFSLSYSG